MDVTPCDAVRPPAPRALARGPAPGQFRRATETAPTRNGPRMNTSAIITFVVVAGIVWGGFIVIAVTALRKESSKPGEG